MTPRPVTREEYARLDGVNFSTLKHILRSPEHYRAAVDNPEKEDPTRYAVGTLCHAMVLENKSLLDLYAVKPKDMRFSTTVGREWKKAQTLPILTQDEVDGVPLMAQRVANDKFAREMIAGCRHREQCIEFNYGGLSFKALLDMWGRDDDGLHVLGDYKTTIDCRPDAFAKKVEMLDYDMQLALYAEGLKLCTGADDVYCFWIAQENRRPYTLKCYKPVADVLKRGKDKLDYCCALLLECQRSGIWPGYGGGEIDLLPMHRWTKDIKWGTAPAEDQAA